MRANGAIEGAAAGFSVGDEVIVLKKYDDSVIRVIGHTDGVRACGWKELWDDAASPDVPLLCKNHQWRFGYTLGIEGPYTTCAVMPQSVTTGYGNVTMAINNGVLSMSATRATTFGVISLLDLICTESDAPDLKSKILRIKGTSTTPTYGGNTLCIKDSAGNAQNLSFGTNSGWAIINGVDNNVGDLTGDEKLIDLSIFRPLPGVGFASGKLQELRFSTSAPIGGSPCSLDIDYIKIT